MSALNKPPVVAYCNYMENLKNRILRVEKILSGHSPMKLEEWDIEVVCLFLRKSLESLVFSSLIAQKETYAAIYTDFSQHWKVKKLLQRIEEVNPDYYPKPVTFPSIDTGRIKHFLDVPDGYLTKDELVFVYDFCSEAIHTWNPYRPEPHVIQTERPLSEWVHRLKRLLDTHYVRLAGVPGLWLVQMSHPSDGKVHAFTCEPVE